MSRTSTVPSRPWLALRERRSARIVHLVAIAGRVAEDVVVVADAGLVVRAAEHRRVAVIASLIRSETGRAMLRRGPFVLRVVGFVALCVWASAGWIWAQVLPAQMGVVAGQGLHFLLIGVGALAWSLLRRETAPEASVLGWIVVGGLGLFAGPVLLLHAAQGMVSSSLGVLVFALLPVVVMVMTGWMKGLGPALLGVAGVLLLLPVSMPEGRGVVGAGLMVAAMALTAAAMVWLHRVLPRVSWGWAVAAICLSNGVSLSLAGWGEAGWSWDGLRGEALRGVVIDVPEVLLLVWLVAALEPRRLAARWLVAPLLTVVEGYVLMRPEGGVRLLVGIVLLAAGGVWVFGQESGDDAEAGGLGLTAL